MLLLDEATSALDNQSEQIVQEALDAIMARLPCAVVTRPRRWTSQTPCLLI